MRAALLAWLMVVSIGFTGVYSQMNAIQAGENQPAQTRCPISGKPVDGSNYADVEGFHVLTAGPAESDQVRANPAAAFNTLAKNREAANPVVWLCPSMEQPVGPNYPFVQQSGKRIYYCCRPCQSRIKNNFRGAADKMRQLAGQ